LLNAAHPDINYAMSEQAVIDAVHDALSGGGDIEGLKSQLGEYNEAGCSIDMHGRPSTPEEEDGPIMLTTVGVILPVIGGMYWRRRKKASA